MFHTFEIETSVQSSSSQYWKFTREAFEYESTEVHRAAKNFCMNFGNCRFLGNAS